MKRYSELTFKDILDSKFSGFTRVIYNGKNIYQDREDGLYIESNKVNKLPVNEVIKAFEEKYGPKHIYSFYCRVIDFHHTELYIEGEK